MLDSQFKWTLDVFQSSRQKSLILEENFQVPSFQRVSGAIYSSSLINLTLFRFGLIFGHPLREIRPYVLEFGNENRLSYQPVEKRGLAPAEIKNPAEF